MNRIFGLFGTSLLLAILVICSTSDIFVSKKNTGFEIELAQANPCNVNPSLCR